MCGVVALCTDSQPSYADVALLKALVLESGIRGLHACGVARCTSEGVAVRRFFTPAELVTNLGEEPLTRVTLCHTRYSTSGDWRKPENNQPLVLDDFALVFNGCINMAPPSEWPPTKDGAPYSTYNDGEILLRKHRSGDDTVAFVSESPFSFAGVLWDGSRAVAMRNSRRPLWYSSLPGRTFVASTRDILGRAGVPGSYVEVPECVAMPLSQIGKAA